MITLIGLNVHKRSLPVLKYLQLQIHLKTLLKMIIQTLIIQVFK